MKTDLDLEKESLFLMMVLITKEVGKKTTWPAMED
jgi:hypothetical protein